LGSSEKNTGYLMFIMRLGENEFQDVEGGRILNKLKVLQRKLFSRQGSNG
jgi:hypothetical protein